MGQNDFKGGAGVLKIWRIFLIRREGFWLVSLLRLCGHLRRYKKIVKKTYII